MKLEDILKEKGYHYTVEKNFQSKRVTINDEVLVVIYKNSIFIELKKKSYSLPVSKGSFDFIVRKIDEYFA